jgi:hypothetical protein
VRVLEGVLRVAVAVAVAVARGNGWWALVNVHVSTLDRRRETKGIGRYDHRNQPQYSKDRNWIY